ncbi:MAG: hypothetical protein JEZ11_05185 [Desulfobacterales bacterium]|nr:hypothetical protein [Desulfobacterales bacterium]
MKTIGQILLESLTVDQIAELLDEIFPSGDELERHLAMLEKVDADLATTLRTITTGGGERDEAHFSPLQVTSLQRDLEHWQALWRAWNAHVIELGDEEGKYACQDNHWEPPFFDGYALASDLETVAEKMFPLIDRVFEAIGDPDLFQKALEDIEAGIAAYPEWMGAEYDDGCCFNCDATQCILHWSWLACRKTAEPGAAFVAKVLAIEDDLDQICLDHGAMIPFFAQLPADVCLEIYNILQSDQTRFDLDRVHSPWHRINHQYQARFDKGRHMEACAAHLTENWQYGRPLVDAALEQGDARTAESWLEKTFASLLGPRRKTQWFPETDLLVAKTAARIDIQSEQVMPLLQLWARAARELGSEGRARAAEFQAIVFQAQDNGDAVLAAHGDTAGTRFQSAIEPLWKQWKSEMAIRSIRGSRYYMEPGKSDTWVHWLIDAAVEGKPGAKSFRSHVETWLTALATDGKTFEKQWQWLALLTEDLDGPRQLEQKYPLFCQAVLPPDNHTGRLAVFRRQTLLKMNAEVCLPGILTVWKKQLHRIMPDPQTVHKSNYSGHANWAGALWELNPDQFNALIQRWRTKHNRRRNLWRDLNAQGLPV